MSEDAHRPQAAPPQSARDGDPYVSGAFALGWQMAELYRPQRGRKGEGPGDDLPGLGSLGSEHRIEILVEQVGVQLRLLREPLEKAGLSTIEPDQLQAGLGADEQARKAAIGDVHRSLLGTLTAADFRLGKAYGLGRALADTCRKPTDGEGIKKELGAHRVANLLGWLDELSSALPPHAAHSVGTSLERWVKWADGADLAEPKESLRALRRQGELWRALLSGEKRGSEMLEIDNYLAAADQLAGTMRSILKGIVLRFPLLVVLALALLGGGIYLLSRGGGSDIVAGATSVLAALGLSWKALGGALGQLAAKLEQPLYDALLDRAIAGAITLLPGNEADHRKRRRLALQMPVPAATDPGGSDGGSAP